MDYSNKRVSPKNLIEEGLCIGCGSCVALSGIPEAKIGFDRYGQLIPKGPEEWLNEPGERFNKTCPFSPVSQSENELAQKIFSADSRYCDASGYFQKAYVGSVAEQDFRLQGSSGGMVSWMATELLKKGLIDGVAHVVAVKEQHEPGKRFFRYRISRTEQEIREGAKSRYYPTDLSEVLQIIRSQPGRYAVVGIPCFIKAIQLLRQEDPLFKERIIYTLGLFCGHMKSSRFIESMATQMNVPVDLIQEIDFRYKNPDRPANWYNTMFTLKDGTKVNKDWWHLVDGDWGAGFFMNSACNYCDDVTAETADISFGDAWVEPYSSEGMGNNVVVTRSLEIEQMIAEGIKEKRLHLDAVNGEFVGDTQAAGLRQRREGLAYRLSHARMKEMLHKRVAPGAKNLSFKRKLIYRMRYFISKWSHRIFWVSSKLNFPQLYIIWAKISVVIYVGLTYQRGIFGKLVKMILRHSKHPPEN